MSWLLNAIVTWDILEDTEPRLAEVTAPLEREHGQAFANDDAEWYGGPKRMEATFFGAAFSCAAARCRRCSFEFAPQLSQALRPPSP